MITAKKAYEMAQDNRFFNSEFIALRKRIELDITSEADTGHRSTVFTRPELGDVTGIEFIIDELRENGFEVTVNRNSYHEFSSMFVSW